MIYAIGETVIDLIFKNMQPVAAKVGGSALNTSVSLGRLGNQVSFISEIGDDAMGDWCKSFLTENGVDTFRLVQYKNKKTSLAIAFLNENNDAKYQFYKEFTDEMPKQSLIDFYSTSILLFSSSFALNPRVRLCIADVLHRAKEHGAGIVYDPNMRKTLDKDSQAYSYMCENFRYADIVHISDEDAIAIFGNSDVNYVFSELQKYDVKVLVFTQNKNSVIVRTDNLYLSYDVPRIEVVSTIGAGDTFNAGLLHCIGCAIKSNRGFGETLSSLIDSEKFWNVAVPFAIDCAGNVCQSIDNYIGVDFAKCKRDSCEKGDCQF